MLILVIGGSGSGKSACAEELICDLAEKEQKYYLATMQLYDAEAERKVQKHRGERAGKGFLTIEQGKDISLLREAFDREKSAVLLECMSNLTANEMFSGECKLQEEAVSKKIVQDVLLLYQRLKHLVIVTNNVFEDGICYDDRTMEYNRVLGRVNNKLAEMADRVIEVVAGIPLVLKGNRE